MNTENQNPYIGPRTYRKEEGHLFFGRDREARDLTALVISEKIVLFYAQSGAGKSSLINTRLIPDLEEKQFEVLPVARVSGDAAPGVEVENIFVYNLIRSLLRREMDPELLSGLTLSQFLAKLNEDENGYYYDQNLDTPLRANLEFTPWPRALIIDQFEELFNTHPEAWQKRENLLYQLAQAMQDDPYLRLILVMREDYIAALDPYVHILPGGLRVRYYIERLSGDAAIQAVRGPVEKLRPYESGVAEKLVEDLSSIKVQKPNGSLTFELGQYIEPVQLQVVCANLWKNLKPGRSNISEKDIREVGDVNTSLGNYYAERVKKVAEAKNVKERKIREWFREKLISPGGIRTPVLKEYNGDSGGLDDQIVQALHDLVRAEQRGGATFYELTHDRLVEPIISDNKKWEEENSSPIQKQVTLWLEHGKNESWLLIDQALVEMEEWASKKPDELSEAEYEFLAACKKHQEQQNERLEHQRRELDMAVKLAKEREISARRSKRFTFISLGLFCVTLVAAVFALLAWQNAESERFAAEEAEKEALLAKSEGEIQKNIAKENARMSRLGELAGLALSEKDNRFDMALLFGIEGYTMGTTPRTEGALLSLLDSHPGLMRYLHGHRDWVNSIAFSPVGGLLASGSEDASIILWDISNPVDPFELITLEGHEGSVNSVAFSPNGMSLASASDDNDIILWNVENPTNPLQLATLEGHSGAVNSVAFSPNGRILASASDDNNILLWNVENPTNPLQLATLEGHSRAVYSVAFSPNSSSLASGSEDHSIIMWNVSDPLNPQNLSTLEDHSSWVQSVTFSPDGKTLASGSYDNTIILWDVSEPINPLKIDILEGHNDYIRNLAFNKDGTTLISAGADYNIIVWNVTDPSNTTKVTTLTGHSDWVECVAFSPDGGSVVSGSADTTIIVWEIFNPKKPSELSSLEGHSEEIYSVTFTRNGQILASAGYDNKISLWDVRDPAKPLQLATLEGHGDVVNSVVFSPDGRTLASASDDSYIILWDVEDSANPFELATLDGHSDEVYSVTFSPDGKTLASGGTDSTVIIWDVSSPENSSKLAILDEHTETVNSVAFSPDSKLLASGSDDETIIIWDLVNPAKPTRLITLTEDMEAVYSLAFNPNGNQLASGTNKKVAIWDISEPAGARKTATLTGHGDIVYSIAFSPDGSRLASGSYRSIILWDNTEPANPQILTTFSGHDNYVFGIAFGPDNQTLVSASNNIILRSINGDQIIDIACRIVGRNFNVLQWIQYFPGEPYRQTCPRWLKDDSYYKDFIRLELTTYVDVQKVQNALNKATEEMQGDPAIEDPLTEASRLTSESIKEQVSVYIRVGELEPALELLEQAETIQLDLQYGSSGLNNICWNGSLWGFAEKVLRYCEHAVHLAPDSGNIRDSRGLARALNGDLSGAIEDFEYAVQQWRETGMDKTIIQRRVHWITSLKAGNNPFTDKVLEDLKSE